MKIDEKQVTSLVCSKGRERKVLANQKMALTRILHQNSLVKVPYSRCCLAGLMQKITELTMALIYLIQASVLLTKISSWPLETGSMCLRLHCHLASPGTMNSGQVLLYQAPHFPDQPWAGGPFGGSGVQWSPYPFPTLFLIRPFGMIAPWFLLFSQAGTQGVEDLHGAEITVQWGPQGLLPLPWAHWHRDQGSVVRCTQHPSGWLEIAFLTKKPFPMTDVSKPSKQAVLSKDFWPY